MTGKHLGEKHGLTPPDDDRLFRQCLAVVDAAAGRTHSEDGSVAGAVREIIRITMGESNNDD